MFSGIETPKSLPVTAFKIAEATRPCSEGLIGVLTSAFAPVKLKTESK